MPVGVRAGPPTRRRKAKRWACPAPAVAPSLKRVRPTADFNRSLRSLVKAMGYSLSEHGITASVAERPPGEPRAADLANLVPATSERQIFDALGLTWMAPEQRSL
eukprot:2796431-Prymnesium_polylepis.2